MIDSQKKLVDSWMQSFSDKAIQINLSESFEKMLSFQQELISSVLDAQRVSANLAVETQKQFWENYFQTTQKMAEQTKSN
ncbi:MAG: thylakoid-associated protein [Microcoleaceae cyanobacterium]